MSVYAVQEINKGRGGSKNREAVREYTRTFLVNTTSPFDNAATIIGSGAIPGWLSIFSAGGVTDLRARVKDIRCTPRDELSPYWWDVTVKYDTQVEQGEKADAIDSEAYPDNPLIRPPEERWEKLVLNEVREADFNDEAYRNSAGELFSPLPDNAVTYPVKVIVRNESVSPGPDKIKFCNCINNDTFRDYGRLKWKCIDISSSPGEEQVGGFTIRYEQVRYEFALKNDDFGWKLRLIDKGSKELVGVVVNGAAALELKYRRDTTNAIITEEGLLDGNGKFLPKVAPNQPQPDPFFKEFFANKALNFSELGL